MVNIDCPESVNPDKSKNSEAGKEAAAFTSSLLREGQRVWLQRETSDTDKYGRLLRHVWIEEPTDPRDEKEIATKMLDAILVANGHARVVDYPPDTAYSAALRNIRGRSGTARFENMAWYNRTTLRERHPMAIAVPIRDTKDTGRFSKLVHDGREVTVTKNGYEEFIALAPEEYDSLRYRASMGDLFSELLKSERGGSSSYEEFRDEVRLDYDL